jgi:hypothetical protein
VIAFAENMREKKTYVVQAATTLAKLNNLDCCIKTIQALITKSTVASELETFFEM